jgi:iron-sulfur cluster assembly accessory protein
MENPIQLTKNAVEKLKEVISKESLAQPKLRVGLKGGGCAGYEFILDFVEEVKEYDYEFEQDGIQLVIDETSANHLKGTTIDYVDELMDSGFKFNNGAFQRTCGCGKSVGM